MDVVIVPLTKGQATIIDAGDVSLIQGYRWYAVPSKSRWYAYGRKHGTKGITQPLVSMHRVLMGFPDCDVDHANGDGLDNRRSVNLRRATRSQNIHNRETTNGKSGYRGVFWNGYSWTARITAETKDYIRGGHKTPESAARAYDALARFYLGPFARLNFPNEKTAALEPKRKRGRPRKDAVCLGLASAVAA